MSQYRTIILENQLSTLNDFDPKALGRIQLGKFTLDNEVTESLTLVKKIVQETINIVRNSTLVEYSRMETAIETYISSLRQLTTYSDENYINGRIDISKEIKNKTSNILTVWIEIFPYKFSELLTTFNNLNVLFEGISTRIRDLESSSYADDALTEFENKSQKSLESFEESSKKITEELKAEIVKIETLNKESASNKKLLEDKILKFQEEYNAIFSDIALLKQTHLLKDKIERSSKNLRYWKSFIIGLSLIILWLAFTYITNASEEISIYQNLLNLRVNNINLARELSLYLIIKNSLLRLFTVGFLVYILKVAIKLHNAISHNIWILNQKIFSLDAARDLTFGMPESSDKKDIYSLAASEIFKQAKTGFLFKDDDKFDLSFIERIKSIVK